MSDGVTTVLPAALLEETKQLASTLPLPWPLPPDAARFTFQPTNDAEPDLPVLVCPRRPKWRYEMTKLEVERNEEGVFRKWLAQTDSQIEMWKKNDVHPIPSDEDAEPPPRTTMPRSTGSG